jgi:DNA-binding HxlR family transcriptional regulator
MKSASPIAELCSIERTLQIVGERWSLLVLREILLYGHSKFGDIERSLTIAPNVLSERLATMVDAGVLEKREYREAGARARFSYHPTDAGRDLILVLAALQQWGDEHNAPDGGATIARSFGSSPARVAMVDASQKVHSLEDLTFEPTAAYIRST